MSTMFVILHLWIVLIKPQRITLSHSLTTNDNGWVNKYSGGTSPIGHWGSYSLCPSGGSCLQLIYWDDVYTYMDTIGYMDIQISYDVRTDGLTSGELEFYWSLGNADPDDDSKWFKWTISDHTCNSAVCNVGPSTASNSWEDATGLGIAFWAHWQDTTKDAYLNNVLVTGVPIPNHPITPHPSRRSSPSPTPHPTKRPTPNPTKKPTAQPTTRSLTQPGTMTCGASTLGEYSNAGDQLIFEVNMPFAGELIFDASNSNFAISGIDAQTKLGSYLGSDSDNDGVISLNPA
eukprot:652262_1